MGKPHSRREGFPAWTRGSDSGEESARRAVGQDMADRHQQPARIGLLEIVGYVQLRRFQRSQHHHTGAKIAMMVMMAVARVVSGRHGMVARIMISIMVVIMIGGGIGIMMIGVMVLMMLAGRMVIVVQRNVGKQHVPVIGAGNGMLHPSHEAGGNGLDKNHHQRRAKHGAGPLQDGAAPFHDSQTSGWQPDPQSGEWHGSPRPGFYKGRCSCALCRKLRNR